MPTLSELMDDLGGSILELAAMPANADAELSGRVVLHDPLDPPEVAAGDLVAALGLVAGPDSDALLHALADQGAVAVITKPGANPAALADRAAAAGIGLVVVRPGSSWAQVMSLVGAAVARDTFGLPGDDAAGVHAGDLFAMANIVAELVNAPVTIEDPHSRVIAFSTRQEEADAARTATILGRAVPEEWSTRLREAGVFRRLATEREPIYVENLAPDVMPRLAVAVRSGDTVLGSMWAAVHEDPGAERRRAFAESANVVALHLLRHRIAADAERSLEGELVSAVLAGGPLADDAVQRLNLHGTTFRVIAIAIDGEVRGPAAALTRLKNLASLNLGGSEARPVTGVIAGVVYAITPGTAAPSRAARGAVEAFATRAATSVGGRVIAGIGLPVDSVRDIPRSRVSADEVLRVLRETRRDDTVAELGDVRAEVLLRRFADACIDQPTVAASPVALLRDSDAHRKTAFVSTARAFLDAFGDVEEAARALGVHANTVRYRLNQMQSMTGAWWRNPDERIAVELELRLLD